MPIEIKVTAADPHSAALELLGLVEAFRGQEEPETVQAEPAPKADTKADTKEPVVKLKTTPQKKGPKPPSARTKAEKKAEEAGAKDLEEAAEGVPPAAEPAKVTIEDIKARVVELQNKLGPEARSWFRGAFQVSKVSDLDPADYPAVVRTMDQRLAKLEEEG